jgi:flagellar basal-body rod protein FlgC
MTSIFDIAGSALNAQSQRMNVSSSNLANAHSVVGPDGQPYRARQVVFQLRAAPGQQIGGVQVAGVIEDPSPLKLVYDPKHPMANAQGYVSLPNVDPVAERINIIEASHSYVANVTVINTAKNLYQKTLAIGQT